MLPGSHGVERLQFGWGGAALSMRAIALRAAAARSPAWRISRGVQTLTSIVLGFMAALRLSLGSSPGPMISNVQTGRHRRSPGSDM